jgi:hypothetical protein
MATQTAISRSDVKENPQHAEVPPGLIATTFGNLTRTEIREWEKMLGRKLMRLPEEPPAQPKGVHEAGMRPRHQR